MGRSGLFAVLLAVAAAAVAATPLDDYVRTAPSPHSLSPPSPSPATRTHTIKRLKKQGAERGSPQIPTEQEGNPAFFLSISLPLFLSLSLSRFPSCFLSLSLCFVFVS